MATNRELFVQYEELREMDEQQLAEYRQNLEQEIERLNEEIENQDKGITNIQDRIGTEGENEGLNNTRQELENRKQELEKQRSGVEEKLAFLKTYEQNKDKLEKIQGYKERLEKKLAGIQDEIAEKEEQLNKLKLEGTQKAELSEHLIPEMEAELQKLQARADILKISISKCNLVWKNLLKGKSWDEIYFKAARMNTRYTENTAKHRKDKFVERLRRMVDPEYARMEQEEVQEEKIGRHFAQNTARETGGEAEEEPEERRGRHFATQPTGEMDGEKQGDEQEGRRGRHFRPQGEQEEEREEPDNGEPDPIQDLESNADLHPIRSFNEILDATCTEHCSTIARLIHHIAHAPLFTFTSKREDTVGKILAFPVDIVSIPFKVLAKPINLALRTDRKFDTMYQNIERLARENPEEFAVLTESAEDANAMYGHIKDKEDTEYLGVNTNINRKVNDLYLDAVRMVYDSEQRRVNGYANENIAECERMLQPLLAKNEADLTQDERDAIETLSALKASLTKTATVAEEKRTTFEEGAKRKTSDFRNISGWIAGVYNPDNRALNHEIAEFARQRREAIARGDNTEASRLTEQIDNMIYGNTDIRQIGSNANNLIDRGKTSAVRGERVKIADKGQQRKFRDLVADIGLGAAAFRTVYTWYENSKLKSLIDNENTQQDIVDAQNQAIPYEGRARFATRKEIREATDDLARTKVLAGHETREHVNLDTGANETGGDWISALRDSRYQGRDDAIHASTTDIAHQVENAATKLDGAEIASQYYTDIQQVAINTFQEYCKTRGYDYEGIMWALNGNEGMLSLLKKLGDGTITYSGQVAGAMGPKMQAFEFSSIPDYLMDAVIALGVVAQRRRTDMERVQQEELQKSKGIQTNTRTTKARTTEDSREVETTPNVKTEDRLVDIPNGVEISSGSIPDINDDDYEL